MISEETQEQIALFNWAKIMEHKYPELDLMYHIPNEGKRSRYTGAELQAMGLKKGMPDVCLPVARCGYSALYIEMKTQTGVTTKEQKKVFAALTKAGNRAVICRSWGAAAKEIENYLKGENDVQRREDTEGNTRRNTSG